MCRHPRSNAWCATQACLTAKPAGPRGGTRNAQPACSTCHASLYLEALHMSLLDHGSIVHKSVAAKLSPSFTVKADP